MTGGRRSGCRIAATFNSRVIEPTTSSSYEYQDHPRGGQGAAQVIGIDVMSAMVGKGTLRSQCQPWLNHDEDD